MVFFRGVTKLSSLAMKRLFLLLALSPILSCMSLPAAQVLWGSARFADNYRSTGAPDALGSGFTFQLGAFTPGFTPTRANVAEWLQHWTPAQSAGYNPSTRFFTGSFVYADSQSPFLPSNQGYIFGFDRTVKTGGNDTGEWILITNPTWRWPSGGGIAPPAQWSVSTATDVVLGSINDPTDAFHMQTEQVTLTQEADPWQEWAAQYFASASLAEPDADPDQDSLSNVLEFLLGTNPTDPNTRTPNIDRTRTQFTEITFTKTGIRPEASISIESSEDLIHWEPGGASVPIKDESPWFISFEDQRAPEPGKPRYYRLSVSTE